MIRYFIEMSDGSNRIMELAPLELLTKPFTDKGIEVTEEELVRCELEKLTRFNHEKNVEIKYTKYAKIQQDTLPQAGCQFQSALYIVGDKVLSNMKRARELHLNRLRVRRDALMSEFDKQQNIALTPLNEDEQLIKKVGECKLALRNLPCNIKRELDAADNLVSLAQINPDILSRYEGLTTKELTQTLQQEIKNG